jgi:hypothetical protein
MELKKVTMTKEEFDQNVDTGVELEREQNNDYSQLEMFNTSNRIQFLNRCLLDGTEHLMYDLEFYPDWDKAFVKSHPYAGVVKYKMLKRKMVSFSVAITLGSMDIYDTLTLAGIEQDNIRNRKELSKAMDIFKVLKHCNWESYFAWNYKNEKITLNEKDRRFIYDCIANDWMCFEKKTRGFVSVKDAMDIKYQKGTLI